MCDLHCVVVEAVCVCVCVCVCVHVRVWLASCYAPCNSRRTQPGLEGGEVFCYAGTIDGNCRPAKNLKMWPPVCVLEPLLSMHTPPVAASPDESY